MIFDSTQLSLEVSICICGAAFLWLLQTLRKGKVSLGLPVAYLYSLLLIHLPGALAHIFGRNFLLNSNLTQIGMRFTALGSVCFVAGVLLARSSRSSSPVQPTAERNYFCWFCVLGGWTFIYGLSPLYHIPSVSAAVEKGGGVWMLGVMLGLRVACQDNDRKRIAIWLGALSVFPFVTLFFWGFLSYGTGAIIIVLSVLTISTRRYARVAIGIATFAFLSLSIFVNYFQHRNDIRHQVWGGAPYDARIDSIVRAVEGFELLDMTNREHLIALDQRLNQNFFIGLAAQRIQQGQVKYLKGTSVWEGMLSLVPRLFWPEKPVFAGSPQIIAKITGLRLSPTSAFGVGNVMEFQINFGIPGVLIGFSVLGFVIGSLDLKAAEAEAKGELGTAILYFLPSVALINPQGSLVEMFSGTGAALVGALVWNVAWKQFAPERSSKYVVDNTANYSEGSSYSRESLA